MTKLLKKVSVALTIIVALLIGVNTLNAAVPTAPKKFTAQAQMQYVSFMWMGDKSAEGFYLYRAEGNTNDLKDFKQHKLDSITEERGHFYYMTTENEGVYSYYITAYNKDGESKPSDIIPIEIKSDKREYVRITNFPDKDDLSVKKGDIFKFDFDAESNDNSAEIDFSIRQSSHKEAKIDAKTGEFSFTPTDNGYYSFVIVANLKSNTNIADMISLEITVRACNVGATVSGKVTDMDNEPIKYGFVQMFSDLDINDHRKNESQYYGEIIDGNYEIKNVDEGEYYIMFTAYSIDSNDRGNKMYVQEYYNDATTIADAELVKIECGKTYTFDADLEAIEIKEGKITITSEPKSTAKLDEEWTYQITYETDFDETDVDIIYDMKTNTKNAKFDRETGLIEWTPTANGTYFFSVVVFAKGQNNYNYIESAYQDFEVQIFSCDNPAKISGTVLDHNGDAIKMGTAMLFDKKQGSDTPNGPNSLKIYTEITDGKYSFDEVDKGDYYLYVESYSELDSIDRNGDYGKYSQGLWYDNAMTMDDATMISVDCAETFTADFKLKEMPADTSYINITSTPTKIAKIDEEWSYQVEVETDLKDITILYHFKGPKGAEIDDNGKIIWTPTENGTFYFSILAASKEFGNFLMDHQDFIVNVTECDDLAVLNLTIKDEDGKDIEEGYVYIFRKNDNPKNPNDARNYYGMQEFKDGKITIDGIDKGTYFVNVGTNGDCIFDDDGNRKDTYTNYYPYWYDAKYNFYDATPLEVDCGDDITINVVLKEIVEPNYYTVRGQVTDKESKDGLPNAHVLFQGIDNMTSYHKHLEAKTDKQGYYEIKLPDNTTFIVQAMALGTDPDDRNQMKNKYIPLFFDNVTDPSEATKIKLTADLDNINFALFEKEDYDNSITGSIIGEDDKTIDKGKVIAYLVKTMNNNDRIFQYRGISESVDKDGNFKIENLIPGEYILYAIPHKKEYVPSYYNENKSLVLKWADATKVSVKETGNSGDYEIVLSLRKDSQRGNKKIRGSISSKQKQMSVSNSILATDPLHGANIIAIDINGFVVDTQNSDDKGSFSIENLDAASYLLVADKVGYSSSSANVDLTGDKDDSNVNFELRDETTSVKDVNTTDIAVYPNPAVNSLNVTFTAVSINSTIMLINNNGHIVYSSEYNSTIGNNSININVENISSGAYIVRIINADTQLIKSVIINK